MRERRSSEHGFSIVEVMMALGIGGIVLGAVLAQSTAIGGQTRAINQKLQRADAAREVGRAFDLSCACNVQSLVMTPKPGASGRGQAIFPASRPLVMNCLTNPPPPPLATLNQPLSRGADQLVVTSLLVDDLQPLDGTYGHATQYQGSMTIGFGTGPIDLAMNSIRMPRVFYVRGTTLVGCGPANHAFVPVVSDPVTNDLRGNEVAVATCPADTRLIGGGFTTISDTLPLGCEVGPFAAESLSSYGDNDNSWKVLAHCRTITARAVCQKLNPD